MNATPDPELASVRWMAAVLGGLRPAWMPAAMPGVAAFVYRAQVEGVAALLHAQISAAPDALAVPIELRQCLAAADLQAQALETWRAAELRRVVAALAAIGCPVLVLKGAALAQWAYAAPHQRTRADLDLLFGDRDEIQRSAAALAALGYVASTAVVNGITHETEFRRDEGRGRISTIDAHWRMANHPLFAARFDFDELLAASIALGDSSGGRGLGVVHAFIHACLHRVSNLAIGAADRLIWLFDLHLLAEHLSAADWETLGDLAATRQLAGPCAAAMHACSDWFGTRWPAAVLLRLDTLARDESFRIEHAHQRWYHEWRALLSMRWRTRPGFLLHKLFPEAGYMRERYRLQHFWQLPFAYLRRWGIGLGIFWRYLRNRRSV